HPPQSPHSLPTRRSSDLSETVAFTGLAFDVSSDPCTTRASLEIVPAAPCAAKYVLPSGFSSVAEPNSVTFSFATTPPSTEIVPRSEEHTSELQSPCNLVC